MQFPVSGFNSHCSKLQYERCVSLDAFPSHLNPNLFVFRFADAAHRCSKVVRIQIKAFKTVCTDIVAPSCGCIARNHPPDRKKKKNPTARKRATAFQSVDERVLCKWVKVEREERSGPNGGQICGLEEEEEEPAGQVGDCSCLRTNLWVIAVLTFHILPL